jgi:glycosyltransferase involved in cell wall biosynthesis
MNLVAHASHAVLSGIDRRRGPAAATRPGRGASTVDSSIANGTGRTDARIRADHRLRIMICIHRLILGGDIINAIEMAGRLRDRGHEVTLFAIHEEVEPALELVRESGLPIVVVDRPRGIRSRLRLIREVAASVRDREIDVVHSFGHGDTYTMFVGAHGLARVPIVVNDYSMTLSASRPRRTPLVVGTRRVADEASSRPGPVILLEPPIDTGFNAPGVVDGAAFRRRLGVGPDDLLLVIVGRLARVLKLPGLLASIEGVVRLDDRRITLAIVGGGEAEQEVAARARAANATLGRPSVVLTGQMVDPRVAYEAADIVLGMGHSALRAMAFAKPVIVLGEEGFALTLAAETLSTFAYDGIFGLGDGQDAAPRVSRELEALIDDPQLRTMLGAWGRSVVLRDFSMERAVHVLEETYAAAVTKPWSVLDWALDAAWMARQYFPSKVKLLLGGRVEEGMTRGWTPAPR